MDASYFALLYHISIPFLLNLYPLQKTGKPADILKSLEMEIYNYIFSRFCFFRYKMLIKVLEKNNASMYLTLY